MKIKSLLAKPFASHVARQTKKMAQNAVAEQEAILQSIIKSAAKTEFGKEHEFSNIKNYEDFKNQVPVRDYEELKPYIDEIKKGKHNILWKGQPIYLAKTSGTTSGAKYIPITKDSIANHINTARNALLCYMAETGNADFASGKLIFLSGSPELERVGGIPTGRLSGIVNHHVPKYLRGNQLPSYETNCIEDWETKLGKIVDETIDEDMTLISGIPPWMQMYFDELQKRSGKKIGELFPNFQVMVQGGVNFEPYKEKLMRSIGRPVDVIELFPASEGFFAFQDTQKEKGMLLNTNSGIFFEFICLNDYHNDKTKRIQLKDVIAGEQYALIISSNAGLWAYDLGDTIKFLTTDPYRLVVTGRTKHFISAFGEHVIVEEVESALLQAMQKTGAQVKEFTVAPFVSEDAGKSYHEWFIEFDNDPENIPVFAKELDTALQEKNVYYDDLIKGNILQQLKITALQKDGFINYMRKAGKLGGQNKVARLSNDRKLANALQEWKR